MEHRPYWRNVALATVAVFALAPMALFGTVRALSVTESLVRLLAPLLKADTAVALVDFQEPSLVWGVRGFVNGYPEVISADQVSEWLARSGLRVCILTEEASQKIPGTWPQTRALGWNFAKGKRVALVALRSDK